MHSPTQLSSTLCPCGSGLRLVRCCELDAASLPIDTSVALLDVMIPDVQKPHGVDELAAVESQLLKVLDLAPLHEQALQLLFQLRTLQGASGAAEVLARRMTQLQVPSDRLTVSHLQFARLLIENRRWAEAEPYIMTALRNQPGNATAHYFLAAALTETGRLQAGERHHRRALECLGREDGVVFDNLAWNLRLQGRLDESAAMYGRALTLLPDHVHALRGRALVEAALGNRPHAARLLDELLLHEPADHQALLARARLDLLENAPERVADRLRGVLTTAEALATVGRACERQNQISQALVFYREAKRRRQVAEAGEYESTHYAALAARCEATASAELVPTFCDEGDTGPFRPVFIVGFPGSGTALLEQMLARITGVVAADSAESIADLAALAARLLGADADRYPDLVLELGLGTGPEVVAQLRREYFGRFARAGLIRPGTRFVTVRDPANAWHLGFIRRLFPEALIIHCIRHPLDVMASSLADMRTLEGNCHVSLRALAQHYDTTMSVIQHCRTNMTLCYAAARYEELVLAPKNALDRLGAFMGVGSGDVPGESQIRANTITASPRAPSHQLWQEPIHTRGLNRHRAYETASPGLFDEARPALQRWVPILGYQP